MRAEGEKKRQEEKKREPQRRGDMCSDCVTGAALRDRKCVFRVLGSASAPLAQRRFIAETVRRQAHWHGRARARVVDVCVTGAALRQPEVLWTCLATTACGRRRAQHAQLTATCQEKGAQSGCKRAPTKMFYKLFPG